MQEDALSILLLISEPCSIKVTLIRVVANGACMFVGNMEVPFVLHVLPWRHTLGNVLRKHELYMHG